MTWCYVNTTGNKGEGQQTFKGEASTKRQLRLSRALKGGQIIRLKFCNFLQMVGSVSFDQKPVG